MLRLWYILLPNRTPFSPQRLSHYPEVEFYNTDRVRRQLDKGKPAFHETDDYVSHDPEDSLGHTVQGLQTFPRRERAGSCLKDLASSPAVGYHPRWVRPAGCHVLNFLMFKVLTPFHVAKKRFTTTNTNNPHESPRGQVL